MQFLIEKLYELYPYCHNYPKDPKYTIIAEREESLENALLSLLDEKQKEIWDSLAEKAIERQHIENVQTFVNAFKMGANMMLEILCENKFYSEE